MKSNKTGSVCMNATLSSVRVTVVAMEEQQVLRGLSASSVIQHAKCMRHVIL
jgi:hypothetical protein